MVQYSRRKIYQYGMRKAAGNAKFSAKISETEDGAAGAQAMAIWHAGQMMDKEGLV